MTSLTMHLRVIFIKLGKRLQIFSVFFNRNYVHSRRPRGNFPYNFIMWHHKKYINFVVGDGWRYIFIFKKLWENVPRSSFLIASYKDDNVEVIILYWCITLYFKYKCVYYEKCVFLMRLKQLLKFRKYWKKL